MYLALICFILLPLSVLCYKIDCLQASEFETSDINCSIEITKTDPTKYSSSCPTNNILQIIGEYGVVVINCTAPFPLDLDYDGFQPTEAIQLFFWKIIEANSSRQLISYNLRIEIYSVEALYQYYKTGNTKTTLTRHVYPRTGKYTIRDVFNKTVARSMYFFLEDLTEPALIFNPNTLHATKLEPNDDSVNGKYLFPCRSSHLNTTPFLLESEGLESKEANTTQRVAENNSTTGIIFEINESPEPEIKNFGCRLLNRKEQILDVNNPTYLKFEIPPPKGPQISFGFENLLQNNTPENINIYNDIQGHTKKEFSINLACIVQTPKTAFLSVMEATSPSHARLLQQFVLPQYAPLSYSIRKGTASSPPGLFTVQNAPFSGLVFCTSGTDYKIHEYATGFDRSVRLLKYGQDWSAFDISGSPPRNHLQIGPESENENITYYVNQTYSFKGRIRVQGLVPPVVWYRKTSVGKITEEFVDYNPKNGYSFLKLNMTEDTSEILCAASFWDRDHWKNVSMEINSQVGVAPFFNHTIPEVIEFTSGLKNQTIKCIALGEPVPQLEWISTSKGNFRSTYSNGVLTLEFPSVTVDDAGKYTCVASNFIGRAEDSVMIEVEEADDGSNTKQIITIVIVVVLAIATVLGTFVYFRFIRKEPVGLTVKEIEEFEKGYIRSNLDAAPTSGENAQDIPYDKSMEVSSDNFQIARSEILGSGAFGIVYRGILRGEPVAVKTVKPNAAKEYLKALLSELKIMIYLGKHEYLIGLQGANTSELRKGSILVFVEFCPLGNLENYLRKHREGFKAEDSKYCNHPKSQMSRQEDQMNMRDLHAWSYQICQGMAYLAEKNVIHGDLATRNILLTGHRSAKITDFGLSRQLYNYASYVKKNQEPLPWRWMAMESLRDLTFSCKSDIWSYGIVLWEIYSLAEVPYPGLAWDLDFVHQLENGLRMRQPKYATMELYKDILIHCWHSNPDLRPSPSSISAYLLELWKPSPDELPHPNQKSDQCQPKYPGAISNLGYQNVVQTSSL